MGKLYEYSKRKRLLELILKQVVNDRKIPGKLLRKSEKLHGITYVMYWQMEYRLN